MTRFAEGKPVGTSKRFVAALDDERAMDLAGKFVSEGFVLAVSYATVITITTNSEVSLGENSQRGINTAKGAIVWT